MTRKIIVSVLLIAVLALSGCTQNLHGGGVVTTYEGAINGGTFQLGTATMGITFTCNDNTNKINGTLVWNDQANGVQFTARLPRTSIETVTQGDYTTCAAASAAAQSAGFSLDLALISSQGQVSGIAGVLVAQPNTDAPCGAASTVIIETSLDGSTPSYAAAGCLDRGNIVFQ